jgi:EAL domain-containing protein (putative c-di-GMP-specific phosphodiesterase class I)
VLFVDDDETMRAGAVAVLESGGYRVVAVSTAQEALAILDETAPDVIVSDIDMPGLSGVQLVERIRARRDDLPVVLVTGVPSVETAIRAIDLGVARYLCKPLGAAALREAVTRAIRLHGIARLKREALFAGAWSDAVFGDATSATQRFQRALHAIWPAFQPIVTLSGGRAYAYEALLRSAEPTLVRPGDLIDVAERLGRVVEIGRMMRRRVAEAIPFLPPDAFVFVNAHPADLLDEELLGEDAPLHAHAHRVVVEVTERASLASVHDLGARLDALRARGYRIALDDLGAGFSGLESLVRLNPEIVKIDMSLTRHIDRDSVRSNVVRHLAHLCGEIGMDVIAEGVETEAERDTLAALGCDHQQGFLFGRPSAWPTPEVRSANGDSARLAS